MKVSFLLSLLLLVTSCTYNNKIDLHLLLNNDDVLSPQIGAEVYTLVPINYVKSSDRIKILYTNGLDSQGHVNIDINSRYKTFYFLTYNKTVRSDIYATSKELLNLINYNYNEDKYLIIDINVDKRLLLKIIELGKERDKIDPSKMDEIFKIDEEALKIASKLNYKKYLPSTISKLFNLEHIDTDLICGIVVNNNVTNNEVIIYGNESVKHIY